MFWKIFFEKMDIFFVILIFNFQQISQNHFELGEKLFEANCSVCHPNGTNIIIPEKNLQKENLEANGMNSISAISYQVINGKNGMPAFGDRFKEKDIEIIADYILFQSLKNFEK
jgi:cytochrome c6